MYNLLMGQIAKKLDKSKINYMIIGGQAVLIHGEPRLTRDIDVTLSSDISRLPEIIKIAESLKLHISPNNPEEFVKRTMVLPVIENATQIRVNFVFSTSEYEKVAISRAINVKMGNASVKFASVEDLIIHKLIAGRPRDLEDIKSVLLKNSSYDSIYIKSWLGKFEKALDINLLSSFRKLIKEIK